MMTTETRCDGTPFPDGGQNLNALYFTKAPGEEYLRVYAQYNNDPCWVPLPVTLPAFPDLQQVRDAGRNISIPSGSFEDAHFYLRSADGNNMTAGFFTNAAGGGIQVGNADDYAPLNLQPEGGLLTYGGAEIATENWVQQYALTRKSDPVTDFNIILQSGIYTIYGNLTAIANYPHIGTNNNSATSGYLVVYQAGNGTLQFFYPTYEAGTQNRGGGFWYRRSATDTWEYKCGVLEINMNQRPVPANNLEIDGDYFIGGSRVNIVAGGYPDPGTDIPLMLTVRKRWGNVPFNYAVNQEAMALQESPSNLTRKWIRSRFNWRGNNAWDAWNEVGLLRDVYTKAQLNTSGAGGTVHWDNVSNKPTIVSAETDPTVPVHVKGITQANIDSWNAKENTVNKSASSTLGTSDTLFPTQNAVKVYVDNAITSNNTGYVPVSQKGAANGVATLGSNGKIPDAQIPAIAITNTSTVASQAAMLALTAETGDVAVRTDINKSFILQSAPASTLANWVELRSPTVANSDQVPEGTSNLYFTIGRARIAVGGSAPVTYNSTTGLIGMPQSGSGVNGYLSSADWNTFNSKEPAIAKNTAFNKNFGTVSGTIAEGNDSRINSGQTAFGWGNHATAGYLKTETDPVWTAAKSNTLTLAELLGSNVDLNTRTTTGIYYQNSNVAAQSGVNYPVGFAGKLEVTASNPGFVYQDYHVYPEAGNRRFWRSYYNGAWSSWQEASQSLQATRNISPEVWGTGQIYYQAAIQLRESDAAGAGASYGPRIAFHWSGIVASQIRMNSSGRIEVVDNPGTGLEDFAAKIISATAFRFESDGSYISGGGAANFLTAGGAAWPVKAGGLTISESYNDNAPVNGLLVKGNSFLKGNKTVIGRTIDLNEEIALVLGYSDAAGEYEKVKLISHRLDGAARQDFHIALNNEYSFASATITDSRLKIDGVSGNVSLTQLRGTGTRMVVADSAGVLTTQSLPADTSIYNTDGSLTGDRQISVGNKILNFQAANNNRITLGGDNAQGIGIVSPNLIILGDGSSGASVVNALNIRYGGLAHTGIKTTNITAARTHQLPDSNGTYVLSVNGVPADSSGNVSMTAGSNWWDHNNYPANWVAPRNTDSGPAQGVDTGGGLATQGITTMVPDREVAVDDYTLIFGKSVNLKLPDPNEFPRRMLRLRVRKGDTIHFRDFSVYDIDSSRSIDEYTGCDDSCGISIGRTIDIQSIKDEAGSWRWFITALIN